MTEQPIPESTQPMVFPELDDLEPIFTDQKEILLEESMRNLLPSPTGTSAPLLSNPSLTDTLTIFPLFSSQGGNSIIPEPPVENEPQEEVNEETQIPDTYPVQPLRPYRTTHRRGRPKDGPPGRRRDGSTSSSGTTTISRGRISMSRRGPRSRTSTKAPSTTLERATPLPNISESQSSTQREADHAIPSQVQR